MAAGLQRKPPESARGLTARDHMNARRAEAQRLIDEALRNGASAKDALRYAGRQIRAAIHAKGIRELELIASQEREEKAAREAGAAEGRPCDAGENPARRLWTD